jgi:hypothetical protein
LLASTCRSGRCAPLAATRLLSPSTCSYSKSRRKAPIYWPLSTASGSYTLWVYYPSLSSQTLYTAINDFVEPKLKQVGADVTALRNKGSARTRDDEKQFETLQAFELELIELRDTLLKLAPTYKPNHDDGVQISAAPLWPLFRHKPWQKVLKDTWAKLEKGDYDWAHLAMNYWPERVREKCKTDKSLAIAHGLEDLYIEPEAAPKKTRGRKRESEMSSDAPNSIETIVCLANSRKISGRCVAGKRTGDNSLVPPNQQSSRARNLRVGSSLFGRQTAQLLDTLRFRASRNAPGHQSENVLIDDRFYWEKKGSASWDDVLEFDPAAGPLGERIQCLHNRNNAFQTDSSTKMAAPCA